MTLEGNTKVTESVSNVGRQVILPEDVRITNGYRSPHKTGKLIHTKLLTMR